MTAHAQSLVGHQGRREAMQDIHKLAANIFYLSKCGTRMRTSMVQARSCFQNGAHFVGEFSRNHVARTRRQKSVRLY